jgi:tetratricopeptide (TPR) repeat protein
MMKLKVAWPLLLAAVCCAPALHAQERTDRTGTRLRSDVTPRTVVRFAESSEISRILDLLEQGRTDEAVGLAEDYVKSFDSATDVGGNALMQRYFAVNALCAALTKAGRTDEAVETCTQGVEMLPSHWSALNNRGTAQFAAGRYDEALADYWRALDVAPKTAVDTVRFNIGLVELRLAEADDPETGG